MKAVPEKQMAVELSVDLTDWTFSLHVFSGSIEPEILTYPIPDQAMCKILSEEREILRVDLRRGKMIVPKEVFLALDEEICQCAYHLRNLKNAA